MSKWRFMKATTLPHVTCPWCGRSGIQVYARHRSVRYECLVKCGYYANIPKQLLTQQQKRAFYPKDRKKKGKAKFIKTALIIVLLLISLYA